MALPHVIVLLVAFQRLGELVYAERNRRRLMAEGGVEVGARHFPLFVLLHGLWLVAIAVMLDPDVPVAWPWLVVFILLQIARVWVLVTLGRYWTTRIITVPDRPLVAGGPYRLSRHPNYAIVILEIAVLPLVFGLWSVALVFSLLNALLIRHRIKVEDEALAERRGIGAA